MRLAGSMLRAGQSGPRPGAARGRARLPALSYHRAAGAALRRRRLARAWKPGLSDAAHPSPPGACRRWRCRRLLENAVEQNQLRRRHASAHAESRSPAGGDWVTCHAAAALDAALHAGVGLSQSRRALPPAHRQRPRGRAHGRGRFDGARAAGTPHEYLHRRGRSPRAPTPPPRASPASRRRPSWSAAPGRCATPRPGWRAIRRPTCCCWTSSSPTACRSSSSASGLLACPVIFTTAYDEYVLDAFQARAVDYLLKPVDEAAPRGRVRQVMPSCRRHFTGESRASSMRCRPSRARRFRQRILGRQGRGVSTMRSASTAWPTSSGRQDHARRRPDGTRYVLDMPLAELEPELDPARFFRANRQLL